MNPLVLFNTLGELFGPLVFIAGIYALLVCKWADTPRRTRRAVIFSCLPFVLSLVGALFGTYMILNAGPQAAARGMSWFAVGKACLAGLVVTLPPLVWSLFLLRSRGRRPDIAGNHT